MEQYNSDCGTLEQRWCNSGTMIVEQIWWNSGTEMMEKWDNGGGTVKQFNRDGPTVEQ